MKTAGLITAAGLSSRMGRFKPLLPVGGDTFLGHIVSTLRAVGADPLAVVTGFQANLLEEALRGTGAILLHNERFAQSDMFASVRIGLRYLAGRCDRVLLTPVDIPLFSPATVNTLLQTDFPLACPSRDGVPGHPILISAALIPALLSFDGTGGLRAALEQTGVPLATVETGDEGVLLEADTPPEYEALLSWDRARKIPDRETCLSLLRGQNLPENIIRHCVAVADRALTLARALNDAGCTLDLALVEAGGLLHDIARLDKGHDVVGARLLERLGYPAVAPLVAAHMDLNVAGRDRITEALVVFLADKQVREDLPVSVEERYDSRLPFITDEQLHALVLTRRAEALEAQELVEKTLRRDGSPSLPR